MNDFTNLALLLTSSTFNESHAAASFVSSRPTVMTQIVPYTGSGRQPVVLGVSIFLTVLSIVAVSLRLYSRRISRIGFWFDDWAVVIALVRMSIMFKEKQLGF